MISYPPCGDIVWTGRLASDIGHSGYRQSDTTFLKPHGIFLDTGICGGESYAFNGFPVYVRLLASDNGGMMSVSGVKIIHRDLDATA